MSVKIREKRGRLYLDIYWNSHRHWEALKLTVGPTKDSKKQAYALAEKIRAKREYQLVSEEHGLTDPVKSRLPLIDYASVIAEKMPPKNAIPKCLPYLRSYAGTIRLSAVNEIWLEGFQEFLKQQDKLGPTTAAKYYAATVQILNKAVRDRILLNNPSARVKPLRAPESMKVHLNTSELEKLAGTPLGGELGAEVKRSFLFGVMTGLRISDIRSLSWGDIDREGLQILKRQEKTGRVVSIPLHSVAYALVNDKALHRRDELVFPRLSKSKTNTNSYLKSWAEKAGVDKVIGWHTARHTFAVLTLEGGADFYTVSKLLGHTKPMTTAVYARATDGMKRKAVNGLPILNIKKTVTGGKD